MIKRAKEGYFPVRYTRIPGNRWYLSVFVGALSRGLPDKIETAYGWIILLGGQYKIGQKSTVMPIESLRAHTRQNQLHSQLQQKKRHSRRKRL